MARGGIEPPTQGFSRRASGWRLLQRGCRAEAGGVGAAHEKAVNDFVAHFHVCFHSDIQTYALYACAATMTVAATMQRAGSTEPARYLPVLCQVQHPGLNGTIRVDVNGDIRDGR